MPIQHPLIGGFSRSVYVPLDKTNSRLDKTELSLIFKRRKNFWIKEKYYCTVTGILFYVYADTLGKNMIFKNQPLQVMKQVHVQNE